MQSSFFVLDLRLALCCIRLFIKNVKLFVWHTCINNL